MLPTCGPAPVSDEQVTKHTWRAHTQNKAHTHSANTKQNETKRLHMHSMHAHSTKHIDTRSNAAMVLPRLFSQHSYCLHRCCPSAPLTAVPAAAPPHLDAQAAAAAAQAPGGAPLARLGVQCLSADAFQAPAAQVAAAAAACRLSLMY